MTSVGTQTDRLSTVTTEDLVPEERSINRWAGFSNPEVEAKYRASTLQRDRSLTLIAMILGAIIAAGFSVSDYALFDISAKFWQLIMMRGALVVLTIVAAFAIHTGSARRYDIWTTVWAIGALAVLLVANLSRPDDYLTHFAFDSVALLAFYVVFVTHYRLQLAVGLTCTLSLVAMVLSKNTPGIGQWAVTTSLLSINLFGMILAWRFHVLGRQQFITNTGERELRLALEELAFTDALTEISNRRDFMVHAEAEFERFRRHRRTFSLLVLDLDHFKQVNDRFGHNVGDAVLRDFAQMLKTQARNFDIPARLGGEEFGVLLPETTMDDAEDVAARILKSTRSLESLTDHGASITVSIGLTQVRLADETIDDVISRADRALYKAKDNGRNRAVSAPA